MTAGRALVAACCLLLLTGCSSDGDDARQYLQVIRQGIRGSFSDGAVTMKQAAAIPYATMGWRLNGSREVIIVLATNNGGTQLWTAANHIVLQTRNGRVTRTVGLPQDLTALTPRSGPDLAAPALALQGPYSAEALADFSGKAGFEVLLTCRGMARARTNIRILGKAIRTVRVDERCNAPRLNWSFTNSFWIDPDSALVWRSVQHLNPDVALDTEILRPPG